MRSIDRDTKIFISVAAKPGNLGATVYNRLFELHDINAVYLPRTAPSGAPGPAAAQVLEAVRTLGISGCSVTMPLKSAVVPLLTSLDPVAAATSSVNTIVARGADLLGFNTDAFGVQALLSDARCRTALIYGSGSVTQSLIYVLKALKCERIVISARDLAAANQIAAKWEISTMPVKDLTHSGEKFDIVCNATPASNAERSHELFALLPLARLAFDLVAEAEPTLWLKAAQDSGLNTLSGVDMFKHQVREQCRIYTGYLPPLDELELILAARR